MKLWKKDFELNREIERFTVGNDYILDFKILPYDLIASEAHARMLERAGILNREELKKLLKGLAEISSLNASGKFRINQEDEDCHTAIENYLTLKLGEVGKKIHTARSRNDQVLAALRLYEKNELDKIRALLKDYQDALRSAIKKYSKVQLPGYTHMQKAMPSSIGMWLGSYCDSVNDDLKLLDSIYGIIDQNPLGSAAGFGVPVFAVDRKFTAKEMGFSRVMGNPMHCQLSRGKFESLIINVMSSVMYDLNKLATDMMLFSMAEFAYVSLPKEFCTGSSIMPQKKNPDVLELIRAKYHVVLGEEFKVKSMIGNLMSGYNRDLQLTKEPLINSIETTKSCLRMMALVLSGLKVNEENCSKAMTPELYATEEAYKLVKKGVPFREAYRKIGEKFSDK
ncbi:argininosuccinate lyase [Candidatus Woesearchaeota archaeon]|nr:argininosuccinate lyase [Candidatus Woesearchaeota archaeon]